MRLDLTPDQELFAATTRRFLAAHSPITTVREWTAQEHGAFPAAWWRAGADLGWTSLLAPDSHSGGSISGDALLDLTLVAHAFGRSVVPGPLASTNLAVLAIGTRGSDEQRARWLPGLLSGESMPAWAAIEPGAGTAIDPAGVSTVARPDGAGGFVLDGVKAPVECGSDVDGFVVTARLAGGTGLCQLVVGAGQPGVRVEPLHSLDTARRHVRLHLDRVAVPETDVLGPEDAGDDAREQLRTAVVLQLAETCGCLDSVFALTVEWAFDRHTFGRPLASYQELKHRFADMRTWLEACHAIADAAAVAVQRGDAGADLLLSAAKAYVGERSVAIVQDCVQMHGGMGVTAEHDLHLFLRRVAQNRQLLGTPEAHRLRLADHVEGLVA